MFVVAALVANVIVRDDETGFGGIIRSTRISKAEYLYGRFLGAFGAALVGYLAVPIGLWLGASAWWIDHETLGPFVLHRLPLGLRGAGRAGDLLHRGALLRGHHRHPLDDVDLRRRGRAVHRRPGDGRRAEPTRLRAYRRALGAVRRGRIWRGDAVLDAVRAQQPGARAGGGSARPLADLAGRRARLARGSLRALPLPGVRPRGSREPEGRGARRSGRRRACAATPARPARAAGVRRPRRPRPALGAHQARRRAGIQEPGLLRLAGARGSRLGGQPVVLDRGRSLRRQDLSGQPRDDAGALAASSRS